ncbi:MAG: AIR synthase-related protein [Candidatus Bathyarchaeia archaeon]
MTDLEGVARVLISRGESLPRITEELARQVMLHKDIPAELAEEFAGAVLSEVKNTQKLPEHPVMREILRTPISNVTMSAMGVGCRGEGDLFVHRLIGEMAVLEGSGAVLGPMSLDDAGVVMSEGGRLLAVAVDGTHSRLSGFPFLAGFHVARAALRDLYVKGVKPLAMFDDVHVADDGDVGKIFDFLAGVTTVSMLTRVPLVAGSTLRVGGDMVLGDRMVSCVGAVGLLGDESRLKARRNIRPGDVAVMTEGAGGGTVATTAIYSGNPDDAVETLNVKFIQACQWLMGSECFRGVHAMMDVTNGGLRGDAWTLCRESGVGILFEEEKILALINPRIRAMLHALFIDPLGLSLDSLLIFASESTVAEILDGLRSIDIKADIVGRVVSDPPRPRIQRSTGVEEFMPKFRESAYTLIKKLVGEEKPADAAVRENLVRTAFVEAVKKRDATLRYILNASGNM